MITQILVIHVPFVKTVLFWEFLVLFNFKYHVLFIKHLSIKKHSVEPALWPPFRILVMLVGDTGCLATHPLAAPLLSVLLPFVRAMSLVLATEMCVSLRLRHLIGGMRPSSFLFPCRTREAFGWDGRARDGSDLNLCYFVEVNYPGESQPQRTFLSQKSTSIVVSHKDLKVITGR